ncbi:MAG TPA: flavin reductase family protein [Candidatus Acidoferrales bacterium]|nr:flavin reductase family protein [Candidatus Acidoferrales bacterium]
MSRAASAEFRRALSRFATGVTVVTVADRNGSTKGMTANAFTSVSLDPALVLVCVNLRARTHRLLKRSRRFGVSVLDETQQSYAEYFAQPRAEPARMEELGIRIRHEANGVPYIAGCLAHLVCRRVAARRAGDHTIFIGEVEHLSCREGRPLLFYGGRYHALPKDGG